MRHTRIQSILYTYWVFTKSIHIYTSIPMYISISIYIDPYIYVYTNQCIVINKYPYMRPYVYTSIHTSIYTLIYLQIHTQFYIYTYIYIYMYTNLYVFIPTHIYPYIYTFIHIYTYIPIYIDVHLYIQMQTRISITSLATVSTISLNSLASQEPFELERQRIGYDNLRPGIYQNTCLVPIHRTDVIYSMETTVLKFPYVIRATNWIGSSSVYRC